MRASRWARHPPSRRRVKLVLGVVAVCVLLIVVERWIGWPEMLTLDPARRMIPRP